MAENLAQTRRKNFFPLPEGEETLLPAQCNQRIHFERTTRGHKARQGCDEYQETRHAYKRDRIVKRNALEKIARTWTGEPHMEHPRKQHCSSEAHRHADEDRRHGLRANASQDLSPR